MTAFRKVSLVIAFTVPVLLAGCGKSGLSDMSDFDLEQKYGYCLDHQPTAPGKATACENLRKECEIRASNDNFVCRTY